MALWNHGDLRSPSEQGPSHAAFSPGAGRDATPAGARLRRRGPNGLAAAASCSPSARCQVTPAPASPGRAPPVLPVLPARARRARSPVATCRRTLVGTAGARAGALTDGLGERVVDAVGLGRRAVLALGTKVVRAAGVELGLALIEAALEAADLRAERPGLIALALAAPAGAGGEVDERSDGEARRERVVGAEDAGPGRVGGAGVELRLALPLGAAQAVPAGTTRGPPGAAVASAAARPGVSSCAGVSSCPGVSSCASVSSRAGVSASPRSTTRVTGAPCPCVTRSAARSRTAPSPCPGRPGRRRRSVIAAAAGLWRDSQGKETDTKERKGAMDVAHGPQGSRFGSAGQHPA
jgi:hypothetical protein